MKFKLVENINSGLESDSVTDILNEEILNEEKLYKLIFSTGKNSKNISYYFLGPNDKPVLKDIDDVIDYFTKMKSNSHEKINLDILKKLSSYGNLPVDIINIDNHKHNIISHPTYVDRMINTTYSAARNFSHNEVKKSLDKLNYKFNNLTVHHLDGSEANNEPENLVGLEGDCLHKLAHFIPIVSRTNSSIKWSARLPASIYDAASNKFIIKPCRVTMEIK